MITTAVLMFLFGTSVSAGTFIPSHFKSSGYHPVLLSSQKASNVIKPQIRYLSTNLPHQLQHLIAAIEKDDCKKSLPILSPFIVQEFIKEPVKFAQLLEIKAAPLVTMPITAPPEKPLVIPEPPKLEMPEYIVEYKEPHKPKLPVAIPPAPKLPPMKLPVLPSIVKEVQVISDLAELPVLVQETPDCLPHVTLSEIEQVNPLIIPEPPKLPEFSIEVLEEFKNKVPEYVVVREEPKEPSVSVVVPPAPVLPPIELPELPLTAGGVEIIPELPCEHPRPSIELPNSSILVEEVPAVVPYATLEIEENKAIIIPEPPKLPELSIEDLEEFKNKVPEYVVVSEELKEPLVSVLVPPAPVLPPIELPELPLTAGAVEIIPELPCEHTRPSIDLPNSSIMVEEIPALVPHATLEIAENNPIIIPEPPKLPELSIEDIEQFKNKVPEYVVVSEEPKEPLVSVVIPPAPVLPPIELPELPLTAGAVEIIPELPCEHPRPSIDLPNSSILVEEMPALMPYATLEIEENKPIIIPEPPKLPELSIEDIEQFKNKVPEYVAVSEEPKELLVSVVVPPAPVLPPIKLPELPLTAGAVEIIHELPCEHPRPSIDLPNTSILVEEIPALAPYATLEIEENKPIIIPEPPKLPELSIEDLEQFKNKVPEYVVVSEEPKEPSVSVVVPPAPVLSPIELPELPLTAAAIGIIPEVPQIPQFPVELLVESKVPEAILVEIERPKIPLNSLLLSPAHIQSYPILTSQKPVENLSIPNFYHSKKCVDEIVLSRILPKIGMKIKSSISKGPVPYVSVGPIGF